MSDLFDIANLITSVGVDAVKIKSEPGLPEKSSNEILTELFSTFDVDEPTASPDNENDENDDQEVPDAGVKTDNALVKPRKEEKLSGKRKKSKKKHKHKDKKHKKKSKRNSSDTSDAETSNHKKKKKHKKKSKRRHDSESSRSSDNVDITEKAARSENVTEKSKLHKTVNAVNGSKIETKSNLSTKKKSDNQVLEHTKGSLSSDSPLLPPIVSQFEDDLEDKIIPKLIEKSKPAQGKILIKDLKNSVAYNEAVKEVENKQKEKAARMEDGEISDSSHDSRTPTLSPTPSPRRNSYRSPSLSPPLGSTKNRAFSPTKEAVSSRNDLRLVLRERGKKRLVVKGKSKSHGEKENRDDKVHKDHGHTDAKNQDGKRSHSSHSRERKRSDSQNRLRSHRSRSPDRGKRRERSREDRGRSHERRESARSRDRRRHRSRSNDRHVRSERSRSRERKERIEIDKRKLLEIARKNAINMIKQGTLPLAQQDKAIAAIQAGGKTVDELTDFCKSLSKSEELGELSSISSDEDGSGSEKGFHHPFLIKERPSAIIMNIKDAKQLPTKTFQEKTAESSNQLRLQFPVSSGQLHRKTESEWIPVTPKKPEPKKTFVQASTVTAPAPFSIIPPSTQMPPQISTQVPVQTPMPVSVPKSIPLPASLPVIQPTIFPPPPTAEAVDIGAIVSQRLAAMRKLRENPHDVTALNEMYRAQNEMKTWAESKQMPGQFTGSTGAKVLTPAELTSGYQAWARKDQLVSAQPVSGGMGMALLQKMGWRPGEGLGKNKEGTLEPLQLEVKLDKRGLVSEEDVGQKMSKVPKPTIPAIKTLEGKHPVSLLGEYCSKRKFGAPIYELCFECGPDHKKNFLFKVKVNGIEYKPTVASPNKKQAKYEAAQVCLQSLGLLPS